MSQEVTQLQQKVPLQAMSVVTGLFRISRGALALAAGGAVFLALIALLWQQIRYGIEYDEGSNLTVVANFAEGRGYVSTGLMPWMWSKEFDPGASTGPVLLIPGALFWWLSGGSLEIVRLVPMAFFGLLMVSLGLLFRRLAGPRAGLIAAASPLLLAVGKEDISTVSLVPGRFVGEIAATSMLALMALLLSTSRSRSFMWVLLGGVAGGLAIQAKVHFALPVMVLAISWLLLEWLAKRPPRWTTWLLLLGGIALPTVAFEVFRFLSLGVNGYIVSVKDLAVWLIGQGAAPDATPFLASAGRRLGGLLSVYSLGGALLLSGAIVVVVLLALAGTHGASSQTRVSAVRSPALVSVASLALASASIFAWWMFWPPERLPRVGIPVLLIASPLVLMAAFSSIRSSGWDSRSMPRHPVQVLARGAGWVLGVGGVLVLLSQAWTAAATDFGARMLQEQREAAAVIVASGTPSLPMEWIWNLAQFQILAGVPAETKPGIGAPTIQVYDSIRARVDFGVDDARAFIPLCDRVLYSSQNSVVCSSAE